MKLMTYSRDTLYIAPTYYFITLVRICKIFLLYHFNQLVDTFENGIQTAILPLFVVAPTNNICDKFQKTDPKISRATVIQPPCRTGNHVPDRRTTAV